jgi:hypothetical protein
MTTTSQQKAVQHRVHHYGVYQGGIRRDAAKCLCDGTWTPTSRITREGATGCHQCGGQPVDKHGQCLSCWEHDHRTLPNARATDPDTSKTAAVPTFTRKAQTTLLLRTYANGYGMTAEEAGVLSGLADDPLCGYWKRVSDLARVGFIAPTGEKRPSKAGRQQRVLKITDAGYDALAAMNGGQR